MEVCYQCGKIIKEAGSEGKVLNCNNCDIKYCSSCAYDVKTCYRCGAYVDNFLSFIQHSSTTDDMVSAEQHMKQRKHLRKELKFVIDYYFPQESDAYQENNVFRGITKNISASGMSMYTLTDLIEGQEVRITKSFRLGNHTSAVIRWVKKESAHLYAVGMSFK